MEKSKRSFTAAIFDMDGLILDSERTVLKCWEVIGEKYGFPDIVTYGISVIGKNKRATVEEFERVYGEPGDRYEAELRQIYNGMEVPLKPHTIELLSAMKNAGMKIAIASSSTREEVISQLTKLGAFKFFDAAVCGDQVTKSKPDPEIFLLACDALGVKPEESIGLEDSFNGVRACKASGLYTIMVPDIIQPDDEMKGLADIILPSLKDVQDFLNLK
ncbi:MAG: HAD family phosphatase [Clostridiales bacterium]|nr:HAD family phosphatase [Clostridiales bacterium]